VSRSRRISGARAVVVGEFVPAAQEGIDLVGVEVLHGVVHEARIPEDARPVADHPGGDHDPGDWELGGESCDAAGHGLAQPWLEDLVQAIEDDQRTPVVTQVGFGRPSLHPQPVCALAVVEVAAESLVLAAVQRVVAQLYQDRSPAVERGQSRRGAPFGQSQRQVPGERRFASAWIAEQHAGPGERRGQRVEGAPCRPALV
jgi:hypothetical protein